ncbi:hypothetical protein QG37_04165 [Candidozyma auris]|nr:hypothetical protein QG37_04165 [[Candida] auris]
MFITKRAGAFPQLHNDGAGLSIASEPMRSIVAFLSVDHLWWQLSTSKMAP